MGVIDNISGKWVADSDMDPRTNIMGLKYWGTNAKGEEIEGTFRGVWPGGVRPEGLYWHFPTAKTSEAGK